MEQVRLAPFRHIYFVGTIFRSRTVPQGLVLLQILLLKNRQGDTSDKNNYHPIAVVTAFFKLFELCTMSLIKSHPVFQACVRFRVEPG